MSANMRVPTVNQTVEVSAGAPAIATESTSEARQGQSQPATQPPSGESLAFDYVSEGQAARATGRSWTNRRLCGRSHGSRGVQRADYDHSLQDRRQRYRCDQFSGRVAHCRPSFGNLQSAGGSAGFQDHRPRLQLRCESPVDVQSYIEPRQRLRNGRGFVDGSAGADGGRDCRRPDYESRRPLKGVRNGRNFIATDGLSPGGPRWTINASGALQRSFDQGNSWQTVDVNANPAAAGANFAGAAAPSLAKAKEADKSS